jgi:hypothetical protein
MAFDAAFFEKLIRNSNAEDLAELNNDSDMCSFIRENEYLIDIAFQNCYLAGVECEPFQTYTCDLFKDSHVYPNFYEKFLTKWQSHLPDEVKNKPVSCLILPGTHNSCAYQVLSKKRPLFINSIIYGLIKFPLIWKVIQNWTKNQGIDLIKQFESGIRLFDLRLAKDDENNFYISHTFFVESLCCCLDQLEFCLNTYKTEFIVLNVKLDYAYRSHMSFDDINKALGKIADKFFDKIVPVDVNLHSLTIGRLDRLGRKLIIYAILNTDQYKSLDEPIMHKIRLHKSRELWPNQASYANSFDVCRTRLNTMQPTHFEFHYLSFVVTPRLSTIFKGIFSFNSIAKLSTRNETQAYLSRLLEIIKKDDNNKPRKLSGITLDCPTRESIQSILKFNFSLQA